MTPPSHEISMETNTGAKVPREPMWLIAIVLLALGLRIYRLGERDFWQDELFNLLKAEHLREIFTEGTFVANHPPLFAVLVKLGWVMGLGTDEATIRLVPVALGVAAILAIYFLTRQLFGGKAALFASFLLAIAPMHVLHSQDLKVYVTLPFTGTVTAFFLVRAFESNSRRHWLLYGLWAAISCYSEMFAAPFLVALALWSFVMLARRPDRIKGFVAANIFGALLFLPQLGIILSRVGATITAPKVWWIPNPSPTAFAFFFKTIAFGYSGLEPQFKIAMVAFAVCTVWGFWLGLRTNSPGTLLLASWFTVSVGLIAALSTYFGQSIFLYRAMLPFAIPIYVFAGLALSRIPSVPVQCLSAVFFATLAAFSLNEHYNGIYPPTEFPHRPGIHPPSESRKTAQYILDHWTQGDVVFISSGSAWVALEWYGLESKTFYQVSGDEGYIEVQRGLNPQNNDQEKYENYYVTRVETTAENRNRLWFIMTDWERMYLEGNAMNVWRWLDSHYVELRHKTFENLEVFYYSHSRDTEGVRTRAVSRDKDSGVSAIMTYAAGNKRWAYEKIDPDSGLIASSPEARRGNLRVSFDGAGDTQKGRATAPSFAVENKSGADVTFTAMWLASDALVTFSSFTDDAPRLDRWTLNPAAYRAGKVRFSGIPIAHLTMEVPGEASMHKQIEIPPGNYAPAILGRVSAPNENHGSLQLRIGHTPIKLCCSDDGLIKESWNWTTLPTIRIDDSAAQIEVIAIHAEHPEPIQVDLAYLSLSRSTSTETRELTGAQSEQATLAPGETRTWKMALTLRDRIDVWVFEADESGHAYHIFRILD